MASGFQFLLRSPQSPSSGATLTPNISDRIFHNTMVPSTVLNCLSSLEFLSDNADILLMAPKAQMKLSAYLIPSLGPSSRHPPLRPETARLLSCSLPNSRDWLSAVPLKALELTLPAAEFRFTICYRLGVPYSTASLHARNVPGL